MSLSIADRSCELQESAYEPATVTAPGKRRPIIAKVRHVSANTLYAVAPDADVAGYRARLKKVLATNSSLFVDACLQSLIKAAMLPGDSFACTTSLSASLELIAGLAPENEAQAALAVHVACLHLAALNVIGRMNGVLERNVVAMANAAAKLERAFQSGLETYYRIKRGSTQIVRVEHIEVQAGAQAVIGVR